jgi:O-antigen/teichoic acid export membrane protein
MAGLSAITVGVVPLVIVGTGLDSDFIDGRAVLGVLLIGVTVASGYVPFGLLLAHGGQPLAQTGLVAGLVALNLIGNLLLIPTFGLLGAATATALTNVASVPLLRWVGRRRLAIAI